MIWTLLTFLCVVATKFLTSVRLRGLKAKLDAIQPHIDELRLELVKAEDEAEALRKKVDDRKDLIKYLKDAVNTLEMNIKQPATSLETAERVQLMQTVESESSL